MKNILIIFSVVVALMLTSCGHNPAFLGAGTKLDFGSPEYGQISYFDGLGAISIGKENTRITIASDSTAGISFDPATNTLKGIREMSIETGPQLNGYIKDAPPETVKAYYSAVKAYYQARQPEATIPAEKSTKATSDVSSVVKNAVASLYSRIKSSDEPFECKDGNCTLTDLKAIGTTSYHAAVASKLLTYADASEKPAEEGQHTNYDNLVAFVARMAKLQAEGKSTTRLRINSATVKDNKLTALEIGFENNDGQWETCNCVECIAFDD